MCKAFMHASLAGALHLCATAQAEIVAGLNWADEVVDYSAHVQNYGGLLMDETTTWWLTGAPDADVTGNGYAWDVADQDSVAGWRTTDAGEFVLLHWDLGLPDRVGNDLWIYHYAGPYADAQVSASADGVEFEVLGNMHGGTPGYMQATGFDWAGLFDTCVHYVRILRSTSGPQTGAFIDAVGGQAFWGDFDGDCDWDLADFRQLQTCFTGAGAGPGAAHCAPGDLDDDADLDGDDWGLLAEQMTGPAQ